MDRALASEASRPGSTPGGRTNLCKTNLSNPMSILISRLKSCNICPRNCKVNRLEGKTGYCKTGLDFSVASYNVHHGEEPPISGTNGSGAIFFANCNLSCVFCQNYPISQLGNGKPCNIKKLTEIMLELEQKGVHNINLVTPTHISAQIAIAIKKAKLQGLKIPVVYNTNGYDSVETLKALDGLIDIYLPDAKYSKNTNSKKYSNANNYWQINKKALTEMHRQVGKLKINKNGIATKGLIIRHLLLPKNISGTKEVIRFIANKISKDTFVSFMAQYHPAYNAFKYKELNRKITTKEYSSATQALEEFGITNGWVQEL